LTAFALPTIVAGVVLLTLYGGDSPVGIHLVGTRWGIFVALLFVTLIAVGPLVRGASRPAASFGLIPDPTR